MAYRVVLPVVVALALSGGLAAQDTRYPPLGEGVPGPDFCGEAGFLPLGGQIPGPGGPEHAAAWLADLRHWRTERLIRAGYDDREYVRPELAWTQRAIVEHVLMVHDRAFYDPVARAYTVDRVLDDLTARFGGIDAVLVWHSYPNLGVDDRNQYDLVRDMPGGVEGVKQMVDAFHRRGVKVLFPINLWDQGTRPEGVPDAVAISRLMASIGADGLNGDTLSGFPRVFRTASDEAGRPLVLEPTDSPPAQALPWNAMSWGICWKYSFEPLVSTFKWLEPRHMVRVAPRWGHDKTHDLQFAFFNGAGFLSWENIWGIWNGLTARDSETLRRVAAIGRAFAPLLTSADWEPFAPTEQPGIYASRFPRADETLWLLVNRNDHEVSGRQLSVPSQAGLRYYDLWSRRELVAQPGASRVALNFTLEAHGFGAVLASRRSPDDVFASTSPGPSIDWARPLRDYPARWQVLPQRIVDVAPTAAASSAPPGMVRVGGGRFDFRVSGIEIEGGDSAGVDVQFPWEEAPRRHHRIEIDVAPFYIDRHPVTNAEFKRFIDATGYRPADAHNFLRHFVGSTYPEGWGNKPVTWVALDDARAYAQWAGKRLPREWEWQMAAQGTDQRVYPWGNEWDGSAVPAAQTGRTLVPLPDVGAYSRGASPYGVMDLVGTVWQWTDEYVDEHTRAAVVRGGSLYQRQGSRWYFPQAYRLDQHGKYLLMAPSLDRAATIGFRLVVDAESRADTLPKP